MSSGVSENEILLKKGTGWMLNVLYFNDSPTTEMLKVVRAQWAIV